MPRNETVIGVFVASPSDVSEERKALELVVHELNKTWSRNLNLRLDLIKWETDARPGFGAYPQDVINEQIDDNYDVLIAIFWGTTGSPTQMSESGTIEELDRAYKKYTKDKASVDIMVYFKDRPIPPSKMDSEQLKNIQNLKNTLGDKGGLYWLFENTEDFESLLRSHLSKVAQKWSLKSDHISIRAISNQNTTIVSVNEAENFDSDDEDYGLLDYSEIYEDRMFDMKSALSSITDATERIGLNFNQRTEQIDALRKNKENMDPKKIRKLIKLSSDDMERYSEIMETQIRISSKSREEAFGALSKALSVHVDFNNQDSMDELSDLERSIEGMRDAASGTLESVSKFREAVAGFPRLTIQLNRAKRRTINALDAVFEEIETTVSASIDVLGIVQELKGGKET